MSDIEKLREERAKNLSDVYNNRIPKRVPCSVSMGLSAVAEFAGVDPKEAFWNYGLLEEAADKLCAMIPSDGCVAGGSSGVCPGCRGKHSDAGGYGRNGSPLHFVGLFAVSA